MMTYRLLYLVLFVSCGNVNTYKIEKKSNLNFEEAYYEKWTSGIRGGGAGLNIYIVFENNSHVKEELAIEGIYFRETYTLLNSKNNVRYHAFIQTDENSNSLDEGKLPTLKKDGDNTKEDVFPFELKLNEAVLAYKDKGELKYYKISLEHKEPSDMPR